MVNSFIVVKSFLALFFLKPCNCFWTSFHPYFSCPLLKCCKAVFSVVCSQGNPNTFLVDFYLRFLSLVKGFTVLGFTFFEHKIFLKRSRVFLKLRFPLSLLFFLPSPFLVSRSCFNVVFSYTFHLFFSVFFPEDFKKFFSWILLKFLIKLSSCFERFVCV